MQNTALKIAGTISNSGPTLNNVINVDFGKKEVASARRSTSLFKSDGKPKATAAEPIRDVDNIHAIQDYFLSQNQYRNYALFTIGIIFGIRGTDLLTLRVHHFLNPDGTFKTHCTLYEQKTRKVNNPVITPKIREIITELFNQTEYTYDDFLFQSRNCDKETGRKRAMTIQNWNRILAKAQKTCGLNSHLSSHSLRKTFAYHTIKLNPDDDNAKFALQKMLNHNDFKTTLTYCGITQENVDTVRIGLEGGLEL